MMKMFRNGQRIRITTTAKTNNVNMAGKTGTVVRLRYGDNGAWVEFDEKIPDAVASFSDNDPRRNHMLFYPDECEEINERLT